MVKDYPNFSGAQEICSLWLKMSLHFCMESHFSADPQEKSVWGWIKGVFGQFRASNGAKTQLTVHHEYFAVNPADLTKLSCQKLFSMAIDDFLVNKEKQIIAARLTESKVEIPYMELSQVTFLAGIVALLGLFLMWKLAKCIFFVKHLDDPKENPVLLKSTSSQTMLKEFLLLESGTPSEKLEDQDDSVLDAIIGISDTDSVKSVKSRKSVCSVCSAVSISSAIPPAMKIASNLPDLPTENKITARSSDFRDILVRMNSKHPYLFNQTKVIKEMKAKEGNYIVFSLIQQLLISLILARLSKNLFTIVEEKLAPVIRTRHLKPPPDDTPRKIIQPKREFKTKIPSISSPSSKIPSYLNVSDSRPKTSPVAQDKMSFLRPPKVYKYPRNSV